MEQLQRKEKRFCAVKKHFGIHLGAELGSSLRM